MMRNWVILGAGNLIRDLREAIAASNHKLEAIVINQPLTEDLQKKIQAPIIKLENFQFKADLSYIFGFLNPAKETFLAELKDHGFDFQSEYLGFENLIHPKAYLSADSYLGAGNYLGPMSVVAPGTRIGNFNYINRCASIGHDVQIGDFNHFGPGAVVCGNCKVGSKNYLGANSTLIDGKNLANGITVGAGGLVRTDLLEPGTYVGVPVKKLSQT
jgi:sugar O-acyltransferase (sialic acid O-acetyltransferase NeuD family)